MKEILLDIEILLNHRVYFLSTKNMIIEDFFIIKKVMNWLQLLLTQLNCYSYLCWKQRLSANHWSLCSWIAPVAGSLQCTWPRDLLYDFLFKYVGNKRSKTVRNCSHFKDIQPHLWQSAVLTNDRHVCALFPFFFK